MSHFNLVVFHCVIVISLCFSPRMTKVSWSQLKWSGYEYSVPRYAGKCEFYLPEFCNLLEPGHVRGQLLDCTYIDVTVKSHTLKHLGGKFSERFAHISENEFFSGGRRKYNCSQICLLRRKAGKYFFNSRRNSARRRYEPRKSATPKIAEQRRQGERYIYLGFHSGKMSPSSGLSDPCRQK